MKSRNFIYLAVAIVGAAVTAGSAFHYLRLSQETAPNKVAENVTEKVPADIPSGCRSVSAGGNPSNAAVKVLDSASVLDDPRVTALKAETQQAIDVEDSTKVDALRWSWRQNVSRHSTA